MNRLVLVTDSLLYRPGDLVTGHVWLDICTPTPGKSLYISLSGTEICERVGCVGQPDGVFVHNLIQNNGGIHWEANGAFPFGSYRISFELSLPQNIPGTFSCKTLKNYNLEISYMVKAYVLEDSDLSDIDTIIVSQQSQDSNTQKDSKPNTFEFKEFLGLRDAQVILECSLQRDSTQQCVTFQDILTFHINIQNTAKANKIVRRNLKLVQCLSLCGESVLTESVFNFVNQQTNFAVDKANTAPHSSCKGPERPSPDHNANNVRHAETMGNLAAAAKSSSEWQRILLSECVSEKPCCAAILDLKTCDKRHMLESSVLGTTIKCQYQAVLTVTMDDGEKYTAQPVDVWIQAYSDNNYIPSNVGKSAILKSLPLYYEAIIPH